MHTLASSELHFVANWNSTLLLQFCELFCTLRWVAKSRKIHFFQHFFPLHFLVCGKWQHAQWWHFWFCVLFFLLGESFYKWNTTLAVLHKSAILSWSQTWIYTMQSVVGMWVKSRGEVYASFWRKKEAHCLEGFFSVHAPCLVMVMHGTTTHANIIVGTGLFCIYVTSSQYLRSRKIYMSLTVDEIRFEHTHCHPFQWCHHFGAWPWF